VPIQVTCPGCQTTLKTADSSAGKRAKCPKCGGVIQIPAAGAPATGSGDAFHAESNPLAGFTDEELTGGPVVPASNDRKPCPACGEMIARDAVKCRFCGEVLDAALKGKPSTPGKAMKASKPTDESAELSIFEWILAILCSSIGCIVGIVYMIQGKPKGKKLLMVSLAVMGAIFVINVLRAVMQGVN
jgi:ribosomal protein S27E